MWKVLRLTRRVSSFFAPRGQLLDPWPVRIYNAVHWVFGSSIILFVEPPLPNAFAFVGILVGTIGAGFLYRESSFREVDIGTIVARISREAEEPLFGPDGWSVLAFNIFVGLMVFILILSKIKGDYFTLGYAILAFTLSATPAAATYCAFKAEANIKRRQSRDLHDLQHFAGKSDYIRHLYRRSALMFLLLGGWLQIPLILIGS